MIDIELFAGAGGMALGLARAGFGPAAFYEKDGYSCETLRRNLRNAKGNLQGVVIEQPAEHIDWSHLNGITVRLLAAGTPCQPFSVGGKHKAHKDSRNLFAEVLSAARALTPRAILIENVRGLLRPCFSNYFDYVLRQLEFPSLRPRISEDWRGHNRRLRAHQLSLRYEPEYNVKFRFLNAADFGVPQQRCRVFIVAVRHGCASFEFPESTHSREALIQSKATGEYWERHGISHKKREITPRIVAITAEINGELPWKTVRDTIHDLPKPGTCEAQSLMQHWSIPGARDYAGHSGSRLDWPSKTIKAGVHGVPGGENTILDDRGKLRYYTLREAARLQCFPDDYFFSGARSNITRQIGNAVPCDIATIFGKALFPIVNFEPKKSRSAIQAREVYSDVSRAFEGKSINGNKSRTRIANGTRLGLA